MTKGKRIEKIKSKKRKRMRGYYAAARRKGMSR
jgi:hypothetical protein